jgi:hypothetical protein
MMQRLHRSRKNEKNSRREPKNQFACFSRKLIARSRSHFTETLDGKCCRLISFLARPRAHFHGGVGLFTSTAVSLSASYRRESERAKKSFVFFLSLLN